MKRVHILMGGLYSFDGYATSRGMLSLEDRIRQQVPNAEVKHYLWANYLDAYSAIESTLSTDKTIVIGYSGGGPKSQWLALGYDYRSGKITLKPPKIDLIVGYDPSPSWGFISEEVHGVKRDLPLPKTVGKAICYWNTMPLMLGLGGGKFTGPQVETVEIKMQHLAVQYSGRLHDRTIEEIRKL